MKVAICDDIMQVGNIIEKMVIEYAQVYHKKMSTEIFASGESLLDALEKGYLPDLLFLDIEMPKIDGVEVGKKIRKELNLKQLKIVYVSGYDGYDRELFQNQPMNFIRKPCTKESVFENLKLAEELLGFGDTVFRYKSNAADKKINLKDIIYFESAGRKVHIIMKDGIEEYYGTLKDVESQVDQYDFVRIHKSFIVNYHQSQAFTTKEVVMNNGQHFMIGRAYKEGVKGKLLELVGKY